jgi:hypothetical protein
VVAEYALIIEAAFALRNKIAHVPVFDRSTMPEVPVGQTHEYGTERAVEEYRNDNAALQSLLVSARTIAHHLLLKKAFAIHSFRKLSSLKVTTVGG